ncbi:MAG: glycosyltransferase [SAR86 cluster bacterium]|nr:glycosyltransferase [SAR86 cluster bacterium]
MRIALFAPRSSSLRYHWINIAKILNKMGHDIYFIAQFDEAMPKNQVGFKYVEINIKISPSSTSIFTQLNESFTLAKLLRYHQIDVVHAFYIKSAFLALLSSFMTKKKYFFLHLCGLGSLFESDSMKAKIQRFLLMNFFKICSYLKNKTYVLETSFLLEKLVKKYRFKRSAMVQTCGVGIDTEKFAPTATRKISTLRFIMVSRLLVDKGIMEYLQASKKILNSYHDVEFALIGMPWESNPNSISAAKLNQVMHPKLKHIEQTDKIHTILPEYDIFILPSYHEGLSASAMEAASSGLVLLLSDIPGCKELVKEDINGYLFEPRSAEALQAAISNILKKKSNIIKMKESSRNLIKENFSIETLREQIMKIYNERVYSPK